MRIVGIDPGVSGGIFLLDSGVPTAWTPMPVLRLQNGYAKTKGRLKRDSDGNKIPKYKSEIDVASFVAIMREYRPDFICLEEVWAMSKGGQKQGVVSMFSFGRSYGDVRTAWAWLGCDQQTVYPQMWQKHMFSGRKYSDTKAVAAEVLKERWPDLDLRKSKRSRKPHDGICDAGCIALYGKEVLLANR